MPALKTAKKQGAPKSKGAVRAKSGCYTCRIRRKKCDEQANDEGHCQTCVRLRLECLGFGAKRPEWLREASRVGHIRDRIKTFLAAQGMIKGHSGASARPAGEEIILQLTGREEYSSSSESPPSQRPLSLASEDYTRHTTSNVRDQTWSSYDRSDRGLILSDSVSGRSYMPTPSPPMNTQPLRHQSPYDGSSTGGYDNMGYSSYSQSNSTNSIVPWNPAIPLAASSFSLNNTYHYPFDDDDDLPMVNMYSVDGLEDAPFISAPTSYPFNDNLVEHYMKNVIDVQYLLFDHANHINIAMSTVQEGFSREAASLLAQVHYLRKEAPTQNALESEHAKDRYDAIRTLLNQPHFSDNDAMAALHMISTFLFDGGRGEWGQWLTAVTKYTNSILNNSRFHGSAVEALTMCTDIQRFVIKTTIWFDVLASVSTLKAPNFLNVVREFCSPNASSIYDPSASLNPQLSMLPIMGCENSVVWALAETSALAAWKQHQTARGCLSLPELVTKAQEIECHLPAALSIFPQVSPDDKISMSRRLTSNLFLASSRLYLRSVVSGDYPHVREILDAVNDVMRCIQTLNEYPAHRGPAIRSAVFALFICGSLTDYAPNRDDIRRILGAESGPGNCGSVAKVLEDVWSMRNVGQRHEPVPWRNMLKDAKLLLV